jgi:6-pyruvoyl-tetrahydropterin synthase
MRAATCQRRRGPRPKAWSWTSRVLKKVYREHIEPLVEHQNLNDTLPVPVTTAENIAGWMYSIFHDAMPQVMAVRVWETRTSWAEVSNGDAIRP